MKMSELGGNFFLKIGTVPPLVTQTSIKNGDYILEELSIYI